MERAIRRWDGLQLRLSCFARLDTPVDNFFCLMGLTIHCTTVSRDLVSPPADPRSWLAYELLSIHLESEMCDTYIACSLDVEKRLTLRVVPEKSQEDPCGWRGS